MVMIWQQWLYGGEGAVGYGAAILVAQTYKHHLGFLAESLPLRQLFGNNIKRADFTSMQYLPSAMRIISR